MVFGSIVVYLKKVSVYLDEKLWIKFKEEVLRRHGTLRKLSSEVESLLRFSLTDEDIRLAFETAGISLRDVSAENVKENRPKLRGPASEVLIRNIRGRRIAEGLSRQ